MPTCPICQQPPTKRDGYDRRGRQRYAQLSGSAFSGYRWPAEVILAGMRWYLSYTLSARQVAELLAERGIDVSARTVLSWVQTFGSLLAKESHRYRRRLGGRWHVDELFLCGAARSTIFIEPSISAWGAFIRPVRRQKSSRGQAARS
jgi:hypothetical protein